LLSKYLDLFGFYLAAQKYGKQMKCSFSFGFSGAERDFSTACALSHKKCGQDCEQATCAVTKSLISKTILILLKNKAVQAPGKLVENPDWPPNDLSPFAHILWIKLCASRSDKKQVVDSIIYFYHA